MHILEVAVATNILNRLRNPHERRSDDLDAALPPLGASGLARIVTAIGAFALFIVVLDWHT